jgi:hypothetical protein
MTFAFSAAGVKELMKLNQLTRLNLYFTKVTDTGLKELAPLKQLAWLDLGGNDVTSSGVEELQKALPRCTISR